MSRVEPGIEVPSFGQSQLQWLDQKEERTRNDRDRCHESGQQYSAHRRNQTTEEDVVFQMHPPATVLVLDFPTIYPASQRPVKQVNHRAQWTDVTAKTARNQKANCKDDSGGAERPNPLPRGDRSRKAYQRVND